MRLLIACTLLLSSLTVLGAEADDLLNDFTRDLKGLRGQFSQQVFDPNGGLSETSSGAIALAVPRQLRWEYVEPFPQLIVADGEHLFIFDPDLEQVTVRRQVYEEQQSPLLALVDPEERERQFKLKGAGQRDGLDWIELEAKQEEATIRSALLGLSGDQLLRMEFTDSLGQRTDIRFSAWQRNPDFEPGVFRFEIPAGVDVVGDYTPSAEVLPLGD